MGITTLVGAYGAAVQTHLVVQAALKGRKPHAGSALRSARQKALGIALFAIVDAIATTSLALFVVPGVWLTSMVLLVPALMVVEDQSFWHALRESRRRMFGHKFLASCFIAPIDALLLGGLVLTRKLGDDYGLALSLWTLLVIPWYRAFTAALYVRLLPWGEQRAHARAQADGAAPDLTLLPRSEVTDPAERRPS